MSFQIGNVVYNDIAELDTRHIIDLYRYNINKDNNIDTNPTPIKGVSRRITDKSYLGTSVVQKEVSHYWVNRTNKAINLLDKAGLITHLPAITLQPLETDRDKLVLVTTYRINYDLAAEEYRQYIRSRSKRTFTNKEVLYYEAIKNIVSESNTRTVAPIITLTFTTEYELNKLDLSEKGSYLVEADVIAFEADKLLPMHPVSDEKITSVVDSTLLNEKSVVIAIDLIDNEHVLPAQYFLYNDEIHSCKPRSHEKLPSNAYVTVYTPQVDVRTRHLQRDESGKIIYDKKIYTIPLEDVSAKLKLFSTQQEARNGGNANTVFQLELERLKQENLREQVTFAREKQRAGMELEMLRETVERNKHETALKEMRYQSEIADLKHDRDRYKLQAEREAFERNQEAEKRKYFNEEEYQKQLRDHQLKQQSAERELQQWKTYTAWGGVALAIVGLGIKIYQLKK